MPDESRLEQIADFFGVTVEWLRKDHRKIEPMFEPDSEHQKRSLPPIEGIDIPPSPSWHPDSPGSAESFFWLFRHFIAVIQTQGIRLDKQSLDYLAAQLKKPST